MAKDKKNIITIWINLVANPKSKLWAWLKVALFGGLALMYTFWAFDIIPDTIGPVIGYVDDTIVWILAAWAIRGAFQTIMEKKDIFLGIKK